MIKLDMTDNHSGWLRGPILQYAPGLEPKKSSLLVAVSIFGRPLVLSQMPPCHCAFCQPRRSQAGLRCPLFHVVYGRGLISQE